MATAYSSWWPDTQILRSTDSGANWTRAWDYASYPDRSNRYTIDVSSTPWLTFGAPPSPPEQTPKLGWMTESPEIDPFHSSRMMGVSGGGGRRRQPVRVEPEGRRRAVSGTSVTAKNLSWNGTVAAGSSVSFGFTGSRSGTDTEPVSFKLGDRSCTVP